MLEVKHFRLNAYYQPEEYRTAYPTILRWINENNIDVVSITERMAGYELTINVWYRGKDA